MPASCAVIGNPTDWRGRCLSNEWSCLTIACVQDVLFESKLANMCLKPKIIDDQYLKPDEQDLLRRHLNEYSMSSPPVFTHMYDSVRCPSRRNGPVLPKHEVRVPCWCFPCRCLSQLGQLW